MAARLGSPPFQVRAPTMQQPTHAVQVHSMNQLTETRYLGGTDRACRAHYDWLVQAMEPGLLSLWCWDPKEGWWYQASHLRVTHTDPPRPAQPLAPPEPLWDVPGEECALEFAPEDFRLE